MSTSDSNEIKNIHYNKNIANIKKKRESNETKNTLLNKKRERKFSPKYNEENKIKCRKKKKNEKFIDISEIKNVKNPKQYKEKNVENKNIIEINESSEEEAGKKRGKKESRGSKGKDHKHQMIEQKIISTTKESSRNSNNINDENEKEELISHININEFIVPKRQNRIYIGNINYNCKESELKEFFNKCGKINQVKIEKDFNGTSRGNGYIDFESQNAMNNAIKKDGKKFKGRNIVVRKYIDNNINNFKLLEEKFEEIYLNNKKYEKELEELKNKSNEMNIKIGLLEKKNQRQNSKIGLLNEIINQSEIFHHRNTEFLKVKVNALTNSFKVLYIRKISNFILDGIINKYKKKLAKTEKIYGPENNKFCIIVAKQDIKKISKYQINLIFDFLRYNKQISSKIIHLREKSFNIQIEVFYQLINEYQGKRKIKGKNKKQSINIGEMVNIIFGNENNIEQKEEKEERSSNSTELVNALDYYIKAEERKQEELNNNNQKEKEEDKEEVNESHEEDNSDENKEKKKDKSDNESEKTEEVEGENEYSKKMSKRIQNIMSGDDLNENIAIKNLLLTLKQKIILNKNKTPKIVAQNQELNPAYFYSKWKESFNEIPYKKKNNYKQFIDKKQIISMKEMGNYVKKLLPDVEYDLFEKDPENFEELIDAIIQKY